MGFGSFMGKLGKGMLGGVGAMAGPSVLGGAIGAFNKPQPQPMNQQPGGINTRPSFGARFSQGLADGAGAAVKTMNPTPNPGMVQPPSIGGMSPDMWAKIGGMVPGAFGKKPRLDSGNQVPGMWGTYGQM